MTALLLLAALAAGAQESVDARLTAVEGEVTLYAAGSSEGTPAEAETPLEEGDRLVTGEDGSAEIALDGDSVVSLSSRTDFTLAGARRSASVLQLSFGSLVAKIRSLLPGESLEVRAPAAVAAVRGTEFGVEADGEQAHVGVFDEGRVEVTGGDGPPVTLSANQETSVRKGGRPRKASALRRFAPRREFVRSGLRPRAAAVRKGWRALPPERRLELRRRAVENMRRRREGAGQRREDLRQKRQERREQRRDRRQRRQGGQR